MSSDGFPYPVNVPGNFSAEQPTAKQLLPFGYAAGGYQMKCPVCRGIAYDVDKRAFRCWQCAVNAFRAAEAKSAQALEPYRSVAERCEILAVTLHDRGETQDSQVLWDADARIRELEAEVAFWIECTGQAVDALNECSGDDEEGWDRQQHAENAAAQIRAKYQGR